MTWQCPEERTVKKGTWCAAKLTSHKPSWWRKLDLSGFENREVQLLNGHSDDQSQKATTLRMLGFEPFLTYVKGEAPFEMRVETWMTPDRVTGTSVCRFLKPEVEIQNTMRIPFETWFEDGTCLFSSDVPLEEAHVINVPSEDSLFDTFRIHRDMVRERSELFRPLRTDDQQDAELMNRYYRLFCTGMKSELRLGAIAWFQKRFGFF